jgi:hypothetical protein
MNRIVQALFFAPLRFLTVGCFLFFAFPLSVSATELINDGWSDGESAVFQGGFAAGESAAVRLMPPGPCPCVLNGVSVLIGGAPGNADIGLRIWDDSVAVSGKGKTATKNVASAGLIIPTAPTMKTCSSLSAAWKAGMAGSRSATSLSMRVLART